MGGGAVHPAGLDLEVADHGQSPLDGFVERVGLVIDEAADIAFWVNDDVVDQAVDQGRARA